MHSFKCHICEHVTTISKENPTEIFNPDSVLLAEIKEQEAKKKLGKIRVLIVDESKSFHHVLTEILESDGTVEVVGVAANGSEAFKLCNTLKPDLITLDVNMPVMGGNTTITHLMFSNPCPVVIISNLSNGTQGTIIDFLRIGAVDFLIKPQNDQDPEKTRQKFVKTITLASGAKTENFHHISAPKPIATQVKPAGHRDPCGQLAIILSGIGGYVELFKVFTRLPSGFEGTIVAIQTMPEELTRHLVSYINQISRIPVLPLGSGTQLLAGHCYIGTEDKTAFELEEREDGFYIKEQAMLHDSPASKMNFGGVTICSVADWFFGKRTLVLLSGADPGPLAGLRYFLHKNGKIIVQKPSTCMVSEHIEEVEQSGLADTTALAEEIVEVIIEQLNLSCAALAGSTKNRIGTDFSQKRRLQRIFFTLVTGPRVNLIVSDEPVEVMAAVVVNLSENGLRLVVNGDLYPLLPQMGQQMTIQSVTGDMDLDVLAGQKVEVRWVQDQLLGTYNAFGCVLVDTPDTTQQFLKEIVDVALLVHNDGLFSL